MFVYVIYNANIKRNRSIILTFEGLFLLLLPLRSNFMNKTVELVNLWAVFEAKYPNGSMEDFFRYQLVSKRESIDNEKLVGGLLPSNTAGLLLKIIGRISRLHSMYSNMALEETGLNQIEEFSIIVTIDAYKSPRKTEVIFDNLMELSSGTDMVNRLIKRGYVTEHADKDDKRAKRLHLTPAGAKVLANSRVRILQLVEMMTFDIHNEDQKICIQLLKDTEIKFSGRWQKDKVSTFDAVYEEIVSYKEKKL